MAGSGTNTVERRQELILLAEPDPDYADIIRQTLAPGPYDVRAASDPRAAIALARAHLPAAALIDLDIAEGQGAFELAATLHRARPDLAIIFMAAARQPISRVVACFEAGAEDFIEKPFHPREFLARVEVVVRWAARLRDARQQPDARPHQRSGAALILDRVAGRACLGGTDLGLTGTEFLLLAELVDAAGRPVSYARLNARLLGLQESGGHPLKSHVSSLRRKVAAAGGDQALVGNDRRDGYFIEASQLEPPGPQPEAEPAPGSPATDSLLATG